MNKNIKIVYFGTPEFSAKILQGLIDAGFNIVGVVTEPDKPVGRKQEVLPTPAKALAQKNDIPIYQPRNKDELKEVSQKLGYDLGVVAIYGVIIPKEVLEKPKHGFVNFHPSLLPELRGASPIQSAILQGLEKTGVTIMLVEEKTDSGPILSQAEIPLDGTETTTSLREKTLDVGIPLLLDTISQHIRGEVEPRAQDDGKATYCGKIEKEDGHLVFSNSAEGEFRKFRAYDGWPGVYCFFGEKRLKILDVKLVSRGVGDPKSQIPSTKLQKNGEVFLDENGGLCVKFAEGYWTMNRLQLEGKNPVDAKVFLNGNRDIVGSILK